MSTSIASAVDEQGATTREIASSIQTAAGNTARTAVDIKSVEQAASEGAAAIGEIGGWTARLSARAQDLETKVATLLQPRPGGLTRPGVPRIPLRIHTAISRCKSAAK